MAKIDSPLSSDTHHRYLLDQLLTEHCSLMLGLIVDIGGKKVKQRGNFVPPQGDNIRWVYLNLSKETSPDIVATAQMIPLKSNSADCVVCCELLEHLKDPRQCCLEIHRILKPNGVLILSAPFLYPVHPDPEDHFRFTSEQMRYLCRDFEIIKIIPMGSWLGTLGLFFELGARQLDNSFRHRILKKISRFLGKILVQMELSPVWGKSQLSSFTSGHFCIARKPKDAVAMK